MNTNRSVYGQPILRGAIVVLFLWFGASQVLAPAEWVSWVPEWTGTLLPSMTLVLLNGTFEVVLGLALAIGFYTRWAALLLAFHLLFIALEIGYNDIGVRDFVLGLVTLSLFFFEPDQYTLDSRWNRG